MPICLRPANSPAALPQLEHDPKRHNNIKRLTGAFAGRFRYRVGDWRVIYAVNDKAQTVNILLIAHRSEVYE